MLCGGKVFLQTIFFGNKLELLIYLFIYLFIFEKLELFSWYDIVEYSLITKIVHPKGKT